MKRRRAIVSIVLGIALIVAALILLVSNINDDQTAGIASQEVLAQVRAVIRDGSALASNGGDDSVDKRPDFLADESEDATEMTVQVIDGHDYIGYLKIPKLNLELPIMSSWDGDKLNIAPCRHFGSTKTDNLVIAGHNYKSHFGSLSSLNIDDVIIFTDMDGVSWRYAVGSIDILAATAVEAVRDSVWDLILYTCTYGGRDRVTIFADAA
ncbi:MAG TPA: sortase [Clostridiaceae bacterium]|nr:sortase [Clostridiaceae bacterium]